MITIFYQIHGYKNGHQLISGDINLNRLDQDSIDRLSDISGPISPGEIFEPYFTCYPLPSAEYFVVARTWQDLTVPRAGCVVTKSLIIPMIEWGKTEEIYSIFRILLSSSKEKDAKPDVVIKSNRQIIPLAKTNLNELVEALFLESRQPILVFNCEDAEIIIIRLYSIFWAAMRKSFATCTFSLSQRNISGRLFDLLFAPSSVRSKFSEWSGRRIDASSTSAKEPRHRWTTELVNRIFFTDIPVLLGDDNHFIKIDESSDETTLRRSLLWNELMEKVQNDHSPLATLGLLDLINSQPVFATELYNKIQPIIYDAIQNATNKLPISDALQFLAALLGKHNRKLMNRSMLSLVRKCGSDLAKKNPHEAIEYLANFQSTSDKIPLILFAGVGDGISYLIEHPNSGSNVGKIPAETFTLLLATGKNFARTFVIQFGNKTTFEYYLFEEIFTKTENHQIKKAKKNLSYFVNDKVQAGLLKCILTTDDIQLYKFVVKNIGRVTSFKIREFNRIIVDCTVRFREFDFLARYLVEVDKEGVSDVMMAEIITIKPLLLHWLTVEVIISAVRKANILQFIFKQPSQELVDIVSTDMALSSRLFEILHLASNISEIALANFALISSIPTPFALNIFEELSDSSINSIDRKLLNRFLRNAVIDLPSESEHKLSRLIARAKDVDLGELLYKWISRMNSPTQIAKNIKILLLAGEKVVKNLSPEVSFISEQLASSFNDGLDGKLKDSWIFLVESSSHYKEKQINAAVSMIHFSYGCNKYDPTDILASAFPIVYKAFSKGKVLNLFIPFAIFSDWDKCRTLREDLVSKYLFSNWSRFGLFKVAIKTNILKEVVDILDYTRSGEKFIDEAILEAHRLRAEKDNLTLREFLRFFNVR